MKKLCTLYLLIIVVLNCHSGKSLITQKPDSSNDSDNFKSLHQNLMGKWCNTEGVGWYRFESDGVFKSGSSVDPIVVEGRWTNPAYSDSIYYEYKINDEVTKFNAIYSFMGETLRLYVYSEQYNGYMWLHLKKCED